MTNHRISTNTTKNTTNRQDGENDHPSQQDDRKTIILIFKGKPDLDAESGNLASDSRALLSRLWIIVQVQARGIPTPGFQTLDPDPRICLNDFIIYFFIYLLVFF